MGKKLKVEEYWTTVDKIQRCLTIKKKLEELGLRTVYHKEMGDLDKIVNQYIKNDEEYTGSIPLPGTQRTMVIKLRNKMKWSPSIELIFNPRASKS
tara:strand:- start:165 stop:452 length:288 start_codon:yes stop_codon:yes gene_type:complete